jgi:hypothetical protein
MKNGIRYEVPLAPQAFAILNDPAPARAGQGDREAGASTPSKAMLFPAGDCPKLARGQN